MWSHRLLLLMRRALRSGLTVTSEWGCQTHHTAVSCSSLDGWKQRRLDQCFGGFNCLWPNCWMQLSKSEKSGSTDCSDMRWQWQLAICDYHEIMSSFNDFDLRWQDWNVEDVDLSKLLNTAQPHDLSLGVVGSYYAAVLPTVTCIDLVVASILVQLQQRPCG